MDQSADLLTVVSGAFNGRIPFHDSIWHGVRFVSSRPSSGPSASYLWSFDDLYMAREGGEGCQIVLAEVEFQNVRSFAGPLDFGDLSAFTIEGDNPYRASGYLGYGEARFSFDGPVVETLVGRWQCSVPRGGGTAHADVLAAVRLAASEHFARRPHGLAGPRLAGRGRPLALLSREVASGTFVKYLGHHLIYNCDGIDSEARIYLNVGQLGGGAAVNRVITGRGVDCLSCRAGRYDGVSPLLGSDGGERLKIIASTGELIAEMSAGELSEQRLSEPVDVTSLLVDLRSQHG